MSARIFSMELKLAEKEFAVATAKQTANPGDISLWIKMLIIYAKIEKIKKNGSFNV